MLAFEMAGHQKIDAGPHIYDLVGDALYVTAGQCYVSGPLGGGRRFLFALRMQQAARVSDYTGFMLIQETGEPGRLVEYGPTSKIFTMPDRKETENYITGRFG